MAGNNKGDNSKGTSGDNKTPSPPTSRPTPRRGGIPVPEGNRTPPPPGARAAPTPRSMPLPWPRLQMGQPGVSAFTPYARARLLMLPPPPPPQPQDEGSSTSQAMTLTDVASGSRIPTPSQKRGPDEAAGGDRIVRCSICNKEFGSGKALFGHMRSHPDRGWKGAHPPPAFNASEEFADLIPLIQQQPQPVPDEPAAHHETEPKAPAQSAALADDGKKALEEPAQPAAPADEEEKALEEPAQPAAPDDEEEKALEEEEDCGSSGGRGWFIPDLNN